MISLFKITIILVMSISNLWANSIFKMKVHPKYLEYAYKIKLHIQSEYKIPSDQIEIEASFKCEFSDKKNPVQLCLTSETGLDVYFLNEDFVDKSLPIFKKETL